MLEEYERRKKRASKLHDGQKRFIYATDTDGTLARYVALLTHRRWGKTEGSLRFAGEQSAVVPRYHWAFIAQHRTNAKDLAWPILEQLNEEYEWNAKPNNVDLTYKWSNGSYGRIYGADDERFHRLLRGQKFDLVIIDEAQDFIFSDLEKLTGRILAPTIADRRGRILMQGTPGEMEYGFFYDVCIKKKHPHWSVVTSHEFENPYTRQQLIDDVARLCRKNPEIINEPWIQREYLGRWVCDNRRNVIKLSPSINYLYEWKREKGDKFILGIDFGYNDPSAYVLATENADRHPWLIYLSAEFKKEMLLRDHVDTIRKYQKQYPGIRIVGDTGGSSRALVEELRKTHAIPIEAAEKQEKRTHVERLNSEATMGIIKIFNIEDPSSPQDSEIAKQWNSLMRIPNAKKEDGWEEGRPRHVHDAALYARRGAMLRGYKEKVELPSHVAESRRMRQARFNEIKRRRLRALY